MCAGAPSARNHAHTRARAENLTDDALVGLETPFLQGIDFQLMVYHPYRPLKALLSETITAYTQHAAGKAARVHDSDVELAPPAGCAWLDSAAPEFVAEWDIIQARAFHIVDLLLATDLPLLHPPAQLATSALLAACETIPGAQAPLDTAPPASPAWFTKAFVPLRVAAQALPADRRPGAAPCFDARAVVESAHALARVIHEELAHANVEPDGIEQLIADLEDAMSPAFVPGSHAYERKLAEAKAARAAYKSSKAVGRAAAEAALEHADPRVIESLKNAPPP